MLYTEGQIITMSRPRKSAIAQTPAIERRKARKQIHIHDDLDYYVIRSNIKCERRVAMGLRELGMDYYLPTIVVETVRRGKKQRNEKAALSRYLFVGMNRRLPAFGTVRNVEGVESLLGWEGKPQSVPAGILRAMEAELCKGDPDAGLMIGQNFVVASGTLQGFLAAVTAALSSDRVRAEVEMFGGKVSVEMPVGNLRAA